MKRKILFGIYFLIFLISLVNAKEYPLDIGDSINVNDKTIKLAQVGSSGSAILEVNGVYATIPKYSAKIIEGLEIHVSSSHWEDYQGARSAVLDIQFPGEICYIDNLCDFKLTTPGYKPWIEKTEYYRGKTIKIKSLYGETVELEVDGEKVTIEYPLDPVKLVKGIGLWYDGDYLYYGENFDNCQSDCNLDNGQIINRLCQNNQQDGATQEDGIDCGGLCKLECNQECIDNNDCRTNCEYVEGSVVGRYWGCFCENNQCINSRSCNIDSDCIQVQDDLCGCNFVSVNKDYELYWNEKLKQSLSSKSCSNPCQPVDYNAVCKNNLCVLSNKALLGDSIYQLLDNIVKNGGYTIVLGDDAPSIDTLAASEMNLKFQQYSDLKTNLPVELASRIKNKNNLILIGHPCDNPLIINPGCDEWPYVAGQSLIKVNANNLIIAGSTPEDTRNAAKIVANYRDHTELREKSEILIGEKKEDKDTKIEVQNKQEPPSELFTNQTSTLEEDQIEQNKEKQEHKGIIDRFVSWLISLFR